MATYAARMPSELLKRRSFRAWFLETNQPEHEGFYEEEKAAESQGHTQPWWKVMCLTGVDYFSTLGYQPGIAALAAGPLAPLATLVLVTLFGVLPMYRRVAEESPHGDGSLSMLERLLTYWPGKTLVLALLGFVATGFVITITLSAADATAHLIENPFLHEHLAGQNVPITLGLLLLLGAVFLKGFCEAIGIAVLYLLLSAVVVGHALSETVARPDLLQNWWQALGQVYADPLTMIGAALLVFPALALGLLGFETGVVVMSLVRGDPTDTRRHPTGRIRNSKKLLIAAALIMSVMLLGSSGATTLLVANRLNAGDTAEYQEKALEVRLDNHLGSGEPALFLEVQVPDASEFSGRVTVTGVRVGTYGILRAAGPSVPNTLAAVLLHVRNLTGVPPHVYFEWSEKGPVVNTLRFLLAGEGDIPPLTHEVLRVAERDPQRRPHVHVGGN